LHFIKVKVRLLGKIIYLSGDFFKTGNILTMDFPYYIGITG